MQRFSDSKLFRRFKLLTTEEKKDFSKWLNTSWNNVGKSVKSLHRLMLNKKINLTHISKQEIYQKLFAGKEYNASVLNNIMRSYVRQLEQMLAYKELLVSKHQIPDLFIKQLIHRKANKEAKQMSNKLIQKIVGQKVMEDEDYLQAMLLGLQSYYKVFTDKRASIAKESLDLGNKMLDIYFILNKLRYFYETQHRKDLLKEKLVKAELGYILKRSASLSHPAFPFYTARLSRRKEENVGQLLEFVSQLIPALNSLSKTDQVILLKHTINDAIVLNNKGQIEVYPHLFRLLRIGIEREILLSEDAITDADFSNIIIMAGNLGELSFAQQFIRKFAPMLPSDSQHEAITWGQAQYHYDRGKTKESVQQLNKALFKLPTYQLLKQVTLIKANFDLTLNDKNKHNDFLKLCNTFEKQMRRTKFFRENRAEAYIHFVQHCRQLINFALYEPQKNQHRINKIRQSISTSQPLIGKIWLLKKLDEVLHK